MKKIAIQGVPGSYHDIAAHKFFKDEEIELICCNTFEEVFDNLKKDSSIIGMIAIENTIAGSLLHNYELLRDSGATIIGEHKLRISHSIMCLPGEDWSTLTEVNSHPVALAQCRDFLQHHPQLKVVETEDTAGSARNIKEKGLKGHAAICSKYAAELYGMKILQEGIETNKHNFTRFLVICDPWTSFSDAAGQGFRPRPGYRKSRAEALLFGAKSMLLSSSVFCGTDSLFRPAYRPESPDSCRYPPPRRRWRPPPPPYGCRCGR